MGVEQKPAKPVKKKEVARITQAQNEAEQRAMCLPEGLAQFAPGAKWLIEHGGIITGHIEEGSGDIVIDEHIPDRFAKPKTPPVKP